MNFLAHIFLSGDRPKLMIGNFIGDFVKGSNLSERYEEEIVLGIELHRSIDEYTDSHEIVQKSKDHLRPKYRHYSGVIVDMFYDHFLAKNWSRYHKKSLVEFAEKFYRLTKTYEGILPKQVLHMLPYMIKGNWLVNYAEQEGIHRALSGMSRRTPYESKMEEARQDLIKYNSEFENEFSQFFPELSAFSKKWIEKNVN